jgi:hypothetical protein
MISAGEFVQASGTWIRKIRGIGPVCPNVECTFYETVFDISVEEPIAIKSRPRNERIGPHRYS